MATLAACCACQGCISICSICCSCVGCCTGGGESNSAFVGRVRALTLMLTSVVVAIVGQYWLYEYLDGLDAWQDGCDDPTYSEEFKDTCIRNTAVYRVSFVDAAFFFLMALCACCSSTFNNGFWGLKSLLWTVGLIACIFLSNNIFDTDGYVWVARVGAFIFIIMQQIVLIDLAYRINDGFVEKANSFGEDTEGAKPYFVSLIVFSAILYLGSLAAIGAMFHYFTGCPSNDLVISLTLIVSIMVTVMQLVGGEGNLLTSAVVTAYATFLCFSAVSKTPRDSCNPFVGEENYASVLIGLGLTIFSLFWVTLNAAKTVTALLGGSPVEVEEATGPVHATESSLEVGGDKSKPFVQNAAPVGEQPSSAAEPYAPAPTTAGGAEPSSDGGLGWRFNVVMVLISMFFAMMLTNWGDINTDGESDDPKQGWTAMWLTTGGQWVCFLLYAWSLIAPRMFPDRDFA